MARLIQELIEPPHSCIYLPEMQASLEIRVQVEVSAPELESMLERGWRRFGPIYFRPACADCQGCETLRIPVETFQPSKSQRRARKSVAGLVRTVGRPIIDDERLALYARWHAEREKKRGWEESPLDGERYSFDFAFPHPCVREVSFADPSQGDRLVGLGIVDDTGVSLSAVYFFWDPEHAPLARHSAHRDARRGGTRAGARAGLSRLSRPGLRIPRVQGSLRPARATRGSSEPESSSDLAPRKKPLTGGCANRPQEIDG